jgi:hypothetical protein
MAAGRRPGRRASFETSGGRSQRRIDSASVLGASAAKSLASDALARRWAGRDMVTLRLAPSFLGLRPGLLAEIAGIPGRYRVERVTLDGLIAVVEARRIPSVRSAIIADAGRANLDRDLPIGHSQPLLMDLPWTGMAEADVFGLTLAVGSDGRFKPTNVVVEANGQQLASVRVDRATALGFATTRHGLGAQTVIDRVNSVDIALTDSDTLLFHADDDALAMGANVMLVGQELIQFGRAVALGGGAYRLSGLIRGYRATDWAIGSHAVGERIALIDQATLVRVAMDPAMVGARVEARAYGVADDEADPPSFALIVEGESSRPLPPCHVEVTPDGADYRLSWVPRRRGSNGWANAADEAAAGVYQIVIRRGPGSLARTTSAPALVLPQTEVAALGTGPITFEVRELDNMASRPALLTLDA